MTQESYDYPDDYFYEENEEEDYFPKGSYNQGQYRQQPQTEEELIPDVILGEKNELTSIQIALKKLYDYLTKLNINYNLKVEIINNLINYQPTIHLHTKSLAEAIYIYYMDHKITFNNNNEMEISSEEFNRRFKSIYGQINRNINPLYHSKL